MGFGISDKGFGMWCLGRDLGCGTSDKGCGIWVLGFRMTNLGCRINIFILEYLG